MAKLDALVGDDIMRHYREDFPGIAHTLGKNVVPLTQNISDIPSDLHSHRALQYLLNQEGLGALRLQLPTLQT